MKRVILIALVFLGIVAATGLAAADVTAGTVTIVSPGPGVTVASDTVEVTVTYQAPEDSLIARVELVVDGAVAQSMPLDPPEQSGALSLAWEVASFLDGEHQLAVRAVDTDEKVSKSQVTVLLHRELPSAEAGPRILKPAAGETVAGVVSFEVECAAAQVRYVIFLVDNVFKAMSNIRPFAYNWDTTQYLNGAHLLQAKAYLGDGTESLSRSVEVQVDNPSGMTTVRPSTPRSQPAAFPARTPEPSLPPAIRTESPTPYSRGVAVAEAEFGPPGTAPYVSETGDLIQPPTSPLAARVETAPPPEAAGLPATATQAPAEPQAASTSVLAPSEPTGQPATPSVGASAASPLAPAGSGAASIGPAVPVVTSGSAATLAANAIAPAGLPARVVALPEVPFWVAVPSPRQVAMLPAMLAKEGSDRPHVSGPSGPMQPPMTALAARTEEARPIAAAAVQAPALAQAGAPTAAPVGPAAVPAMNTPASAGACAPMVKSPEASPSVPTPSTEQLAMLPPKLPQASPRLALYPQPASATGTYTVQSGDSLWTIAARNGLTVQQLARANGIAASSGVHPGQQLRIPAPTIYVNGSPLTSDVPAAVTDGRLLAPFRAVVEQAGGSVVWEPEARRARADARDKAIAVVIGSDVATVDGELTPMGAAAMLRGDRTLVPLRFLGEAMDMVLQYRDGVVRVAEGE